MVDPGDLGEREEQPLPDDCKREDVWITPEELLEELDRILEELGLLGDPDD
jgi:hypothetical protein